MGSIHQHAHLLPPGSALHHTLQGASARALLLGMSTIPCHRSFCVPPNVPKALYPFLNLVPSLQSHTGTSSQAYQIRYQKKNIKNFIDGKVVLHLLSGEKKVQLIIMPPGLHIHPQPSGPHSLWNQLGLSDYSEDTFLRTSILLRYKHPEKFGAVKRYHWFF